MQVGTYIDGRALTYDEATRAFAVGGTPVTLAQVLEYDAAGQIQWPSAEMRAWAHQLPGPTLTKAWVGSYARVGPIAVVPGSPMVAPPAWHPDPWAGINSATGMDTRGASTSRMTALPARIRSRTPDRERAITRAPPISHAILGLPGVTTIRLAALGAMATRRAARSMQESLRRGGDAPSYRGASWGRRSRRASSSRACGSSSSRAWLRTERHHHSEYRHR